MKVTCAGGGEFPYPQTLSLYRSYGLLCLLLFGGRLGESVLRRGRLGLDPLEVEAVLLEQRTQARPIGAFDDGLSVVKLGRGLLDRGLQVRELLAPPLLQCGRATACVRPVGTPVQLVNRPLASRDAVRARERFDLLGRQCRRPRRRYHHSLRARPTRAPARRSRQGPAGVGSSNDAVPTVALRSSPIAYLLCIADLLFVGGVAGCVFKNVGMGSVEHRQVFGCAP